MFYKNLINSGWLHALFIAMVAYPAGDIVQRFVASDAENNILVFTFLFMLSASFALLLMAGPGALAIKTLRRPETWIYALLQILVLVLGLFAFKYISATEGSTLFRIEAFLTLLLSGLFLHQKISKYEFLGSLLILSGFYFVIINSDMSIISKVLVSVFVIARSLSQSVQKVITELHKTNRKAQSFKDSLRVTGFIMAVASLVFLFFLLAVAQFKTYHDLEIFQTFPHFAEFADRTVCISACFLGFFILGFSKYCEFYAGKTIGAKYLTAILSCYILIVLLVEKILSSYGLLQRTHFTLELYIALVLVILGSLVIALSGFLQDLRFIKKGEKQDTLANLDENFIESQQTFDALKLNTVNLMSLYEDSKKLADAIGVDKVLLENIINYNLEDLHLERKTVQKINAFAVKNVTLKDSLTKAHNRYALNTTFEKLKKDSMDFSFYLLDLNKFKPVNDKYGHQAGDEVLVQTVERLQAIVELSGNVFRVGGDEFILIQDRNLEKDLSSQIKQIIEEPINYGKHVLQISTSIGMVPSLAADSLEQLIDCADEKMYHDKKQR